MKRWFRKNKKVFALIIAIIIALLMLLGPVMIAFAGV